MKSLSMQFTRKQHIEQIDLLPNAESGVLRGKAVSADDPSLTF